MKQKNYSSVSWRYGVAALVVIASTGLRGLIGHRLGIQAPLMIIYPATALLVGWLGIGPGILMAVVGGGMAELLFVDHHAINGGASLVLVRLSMLLITALLLGWMGERLRGALTRAASEAKAAGEAQDALVHSEAALRQKLAEVETIYQYAPIGLCVLDTNLRWVRVNQHLAEMNGATPAEHVGRTMAELLPDLSSQTEKILRQMLIDGKPVLGIEIQGETPARPGEQRVLRENFLPLFDADQKIVGINVVCEEITESKLAERALLTSEQRLRAFVDSNIIGILSSDIDGGVSDCNDELARIVGRSRDDIRAGTVRWTDITPPQDMPADFQAIAEAKRLGRCTPYEKHYIRPDGTRVPVLIGYTLLEPDRTQAMAFILDISHRKQVEQRLRQRESELQTLADNVPDIVARFDRELRHVFVNRATSETTGLPIDSYLGKTNRELGTAASICEVFETELQLAFENEAPRIFGFEFESPRKGLREYEARLVPESGHHGTVETILCVSRDVTDQRRADRELRTAKEAAERANAAKDQFLAVLSHELRTPLTPVLTIAQLLESDDEVPARLREDVATIRRNVELEARLIDDLLDLTRISRGKVDLQFAEVDLHKPLQQVVRLSEEEAAAKQVKILIDLTAQQSHVLADAARLQQVLWNLLKNAVKFTPGGGTISIHTRDVRDGWIGVEVADTGIGIDADVLPKVFDAFEQGGAGITRQFGGLGLGLAISQALVDLHGGRLIAESEGRGKGSRFTIELPLTKLQHASATDPGNGLPAPLSYRTQKVLLIEDHQDTARIMQRVLRGYGFDVRHADCFRAALSEVEESRFDLIISDLGLPDGNGHDLLRHLLTKGPVTAIALSGFGMEEDVRKSHEAGFAAHLTKPVDLRLLETTLRRVVGSQKS